MHFLQTLKLYKNLLFFWCLISVYNFFQHQKIFYEQIFSWKKVSLESRLNLCAICANSHIHYCYSIMLSLTGTVGAIYSIKGHKISSHMISATQLSANRTPLEMFANWSNFSSVMHNGPTGLVLDIITSVSYTTCCPKITPMFDLM